MQISTVMALSMSLTSFWQLLHGDHARDSYMNFYKGLCILQSPFFTLR
jgi:hypothetical protein